MAYTHQSAFAARTDLHRYNEDALALFALQIRFQIEDIDTVAASSLTGKITKGDDKKCDVIYINKDTGHIIVIQTYIAQDPNKEAAKSSKAADLNIAAAWLLNASIEELPEGLRSAAAEIRTALEANEIRVIQFWYVHNLPESSNVEAELKIVEQTVSNALRTNFAEAELENISALEVGQKTLDEWYRALEAPILVTDEFMIPISGGYTISGSDWEAYVTAIPTSWLHQIYKSYPDQLFSANVRGYLGSRQSTANINNGIKNTAQEDPIHFWVFNNGITALVNDIEESENNKFLEDQSLGHSKIIKVTGLSIVNGAQTTGALGSLEDSPDSTGKVQARFVKCSNSQTIRNIIEYNNKQNVVEASDFRSNDPIQTRLRQEFLSIPDATYYGGRRGGYEDVIRRPSNLLPSDTVAQALAAFHQDPALAYNNKSDIWRVDSIYSKYFTEKTTAAHIVFVYSLLRSVEAKKLRLIESGKSDLLSESEAQQLEFLQRRGAHFLFTAAIGKCLETFLGRSVPNPFRVIFKDNYSPQTAEEIWKPMVEITIPFSTFLLSAVQKSLKSNEEAATAINSFKAMVESAKTYHTSSFQEFANHVQICV